jgi:DNA polymerase III alpha subunit
MVATHPYIELRARSAFSFLEGAAQPEDLVERAVELGYPAIALGDRDGLYGAPRFYHAAVKAGLKAIVGAELTLDDDSRLYVLVPDRARYQNLCRLITASKLKVVNPPVEGRKTPPSPYPAKGQSRVTLEDLERFGTGLICLAGGVFSPLSRMLTAGEDRFATGCVRSSAPAISISTFNAILTPVRNGLTANSARSPRPPGLRSWPPTTYATAAPSGRCSMS